MENREIDSLLRSLDPPEQWRPDEARALAKMKGTRAPASRRVPWMWAAASVSAVAFALFALPDRGTCGQSPANTACRKAAALSYHESGSPGAPVTLEIYSDYECPPCAVFFLETLPPLVDKYVKTGQVKLLYRDFPLPSHRYAVGAARYANAAGEAGFFQAAVTQLFRTQSAWKQTGDIDRELSKALPFAAMQKIRQLVPAESLSWDIAKGTIDGVSETPTLFVVSEGKREKVRAADLDSVLAGRNRE